MDIFHEAEEQKKEQNFTMKAEQILLSTDLRANNSVGHPKPEINFFLNRQMYNT